MATGGTVEEVEMEITILRDAQREHQLLEVAAEKAGDRSEVVLQRSIVDWYSEELNILLGEWQALIPEQRRP